MSVGACCTRPSFDLTACTNKTAECDKGVRGLLKASNTVFEEHLDGRDLDLKIPLQQLADAMKDVVDNIKALAAEDKIYKTPSWYCPSKDTINSSLYKIVSKGGLYVGCFGTAVSVVTYASSTNASDTATPNHPVLYYALGSSLLTCLGAVLSQGEQFFLTQQNKAQAVERLLEKNEGMKTSIENTIKTFTMIHNYPTIAQEKPEEAEKHVAKVLRNIAKLPKEYKGTEGLQPKVIRNCFLKNHTPSSTPTLERPNSQQQQPFSPSNARLDQNTTPTPPTTTEEKKEGGEPDRELSHIRFHMPDLAQPEPSPTRAPTQSAHPTPTPTPAQPAQSRPTLSPVEESPAPPKRVLGKEDSPMPPPPAPFDIASPPVMDKPPVLV